MVLCWMVWLFGSVFSLNVLDKTTGGKRIFRKAKEKYGSALLMVYIALRNGELKHLG